MQIISMRDKKHTDDIERRCVEENGPVYEANAVLQGLADVKAGRTVDGDTAISTLRSKYGL